LLKTFFISKDEIEGASGANFNKPFSIQSFTCTMLSRL
jgi:hypothetical protein